MLPSLLPHPASFFKVLPLSQKFNRFQLPIPHPWLIFIPSMSQHAAAKSFNACWRPDSVNESKIHEKFDIDVLSLLSIDFYYLRSVWLAVYKVCSL